MPDDPLTTMDKLDPGFMKLVREAEAFIYADGALPARFKLLIAMAFDAAEGASGGVRALAQAALKAGATKEEIAETLRVAYQLSGVGSLYCASFGLKDILD